jgi:hypothetical protein
MCGMAWPPLLSDRGARYTHMHGSLDNLAQCQMLAKTAAVQRNNCSTQKIETGEGVSSQATPASQCRTTAASHRSTGACMQINVQKHPQGLKTPVVPCSTRTSLIPTNTAPSAQHEHEWTTPTKMGNATTVFVRRRAIPHSAAQPCKALKAWVLDAQFAIESNGTSNFYGSCIVLSQETILSPH